MPPLESGIPILHLFIAKRILVERSVRVEINLNVLCRTIVAFGNSADSDEADLRHCGYSGSRVEVLLAAKVRGLDAVVRE